MKTHHSPPQGIGISVKVRLSIGSNHVFLSQVDKVTEKNIKELIEKTKIRTK